MVLSGKSAGRILNLELCWPPPLSIAKVIFVFLFLWRYVLVIIHSENADGSWSIVYVYAEHRTSVNTVQFAPAEFGLVLACGSTDGDVSILTGDPKVHSLFEAFIKQTQNLGNWESVKFNAHKGGVNAVSWAPIASMGDLCCEPTAGDVSSQNAQKRIVTAGNDSQVKIWEEGSQLKLQTFADFSDEHGNFQQKQTKNDMNHSDWVRDVAWAPSTGLDK